MDFAALQLFLDQRLKKPLPGLKAHRLMVPLSRRLERSRLHPGQDATESSIMLIIHLIETMPHLIMIRRPNYEGVHSGQIAFPGGRRETIDIDNLHTAFREVEEEIGFLHQNSTGFRIHGQLSQLYIPPSNFRVFPFVVSCTTLPTLIADPAEVDEIIHLPLALFFKRSSLGEREFETSYANVKAPCYVFNDIAIWGASAMIISELVSILSPFMRRQRQS